MNFDDPIKRDIALKQIAVLQRLVDDLTDIAAGTRPTDLDLANAVVIRSPRLSAIPLPCFIGYVENHPRLGSKIVTTSQLFAVDPKGKWVRTLSRFYRIEGDEPPRNALRPARKGAFE